MNKQTLTVEQFNDGVAQLAQSSRDLAARFGQQRTVDGQARLIREELGEVLTATDDAHRVEELCDLIVVCCGYCDARQVKVPTIRKNAMPNLTTNDLDFDVALINVSQYSAFASIYSELCAIPNAAKLFPAQVARVVAKNAAKTPDTHYLDSATGKITRKAATSEPEANINADLENGAAVDGWLDGGV